MQTYLGEMNRSLPCVFQYLATGLTRPHELAASVREYMKTARRICDRAAPSTSCVAACERQTSITTGMTIGLRFVFS